MLAEVLLDTGIAVHYGFLTFASLQTEDDGDGFEDAWRGQANGLVGAAVPEVLRIRTHTHTGLVRVRMELHDSPPEPGDWPEVVEVDFASWVDDLTLSAFDESDGPVSLPPGTYRVRYAARTLPEAGEDSVAEECLLQFWPPVHADRVVRQTGPEAEYLHRSGPRPGWTADELSGRVEELRRNREAAEDEGEPAEELDLPAGWPYHYLLQGLRGAAAQVGYADPPLVAHLATAEPETLRAIACWAAEQALTSAGLRGVPWVEEAVATVRGGAGLPVDVAREHQVNSALRVRAVEQLTRAAGAPTLERTCELLWNVGTLTGRDFTWILAAVRRVFPDLVPAG